MASAREFDHDLRPESGGESERGEPVPQAVQLHGHSSTRILKRYQDVIPSLKRDAADQFDRLLSVGV